MGGERKRVCVGTQLHQNTAPLPYPVSPSPISSNDHKPSQRWAIPEYHNRQEVATQRKTASCEDFQLAKNDDLHLATGRDFQLAIDNYLLGPTRRGGADADRRRPVEELRTEPPSRTA